MQRPLEGLLELGAGAVVGSALGLSRLLGFLCRSIAPSTLHGWFRRTGELCRPLSAIAKEQLLASDIISCDDTRLMAGAHVYNDGSIKPLKGRLWLYISDVSETAYCEFTPDWKGVHPRKVLDGYTGTVQGDGYDGLNPLFGGPGGPKKVGCNDHGRRKFVAALRDGDQRAERAVDIYRALYALERQARNEKMKPPDVLALRQSKSKLIWQTLAEEVGRLKLDVEPKSTLGKAVTYWHRQRPFLAAFLDDGELPIANAHVERLLRTVALFRKNSLFVGSEEAGQRYAMLLTVMMNCVLCGTNPYDYFSAVINDLSHHTPAVDFDSIMPRAWAASQMAQQPE